MADWIKMRTDLYRDPKVCIMADLLMAKDSELALFVSHNCKRDMAVTRNVMRNVTVGALVTLWGVTRHRGKRDGDDLFIRGITLSVLDDIADLPGIGNAMSEVGWAEEADGGIVFPRFFEEFNVDPTEDGKKKNAARQRKHREKRNALRNVTVTSQSNVREEERREEIKKEVIYPRAYANQVDDLPEIPVEGKEGQGASRASETFDRVWAAFPLQIGREAALKEWRAIVFRLGMSDSLLNEIVDSVRKWTPYWSSLPQDKITWPKNWLKDEQWKEKPPQMEKSAKPEPPKQETFAEIVHRRAKEAKERNSQ